MMRVKGTRMAARLSEAFLALSTVPSGARVLGSTEGADRIRVICVEEQERGGGLAGWAMGRTRVAECVAHCKRLA